MKERLWLRVEYADMISLYHSGNLICPQPIQSSVVSHLQIKAMRVIILWAFRMN